VCARGPVSQAKPRTDVQIQTVPHSTSRVRARARMKVRDYLLIGLHSLARMQHVRGCSICVWMQHARGCDERTQRDAACKPSH
jgi:hypothetical protein